MLTSRLTTQLGMILTRRNDHLLVLLVSKHKWLKN